MLDKIKSYLNDKNNELDFYNQINDIISQTLEQLEENNDNHE